MCRRPDSSLCCALSISPGNAHDMNFPRPRSLPAHRAITLSTDLDTFEIFGFLRNQETPFFVERSDGEPCMPAIFSLLNCTPCTNLPFSGNLQGWCYRIRAIARPTCTERVGRSVQGASNYRDLSRQASRIENSTIEALDVAAEHRVKVEFYRCSCGC